MRHIVLDISGHGFGHAGQMAPVVEALRARRPDIRLTIRSRVPDTHLAQLLAPPFERAPPSPDLGLAMRSPLEVDLVASRRWYDALHARWDEVVAREAQRLQALRPDLLVSNVGYVALAAAHAAGLPAVALCSLNWADIAEACGVAAPEALAQMRAAYGSAARFIQAEPHLPMAWLANRVPVGPVARRGRCRRDELRRRLGTPAGGLLALVSFGGIPAPTVLADLPALERVVWLADRTEVPAAVRLDPLRLPFIDVVASVDLVVTKTGYGLFVEPAAHGTRVLYVPRPDWPEAPYAEAWIRRVGIGRPLPREPEALAALLEDLRRAPRAEPVPATGAEAAAEVILARLA